MLPAKDDVVEYDETSPTFLRWKVDVLSGKNKKQVSAGMCAGSKHKCGNSQKDIYYYATQYKGKKYLNHRIIYFLHYGEIPEGFVIDHKDGDTFNNKLENLRAIPQRINGRNRHPRKGNSSGFSGVSFKNQNSRTGAVAFWRGLDGSSRSKYFSAHVYGLLPAFAMACQYREDMVLKLNEQGAGYTSRHGKDMNE